MKANGSFNLYVDVDDYYSYAYVDFLFDGGPIYFTYEGENYEVYFNELEFDYKVTPNAAYLVDVDGGLTVDGQYIDASEELAPLLL